MKKARVTLNTNELLRIWRERAGLTQWQAASRLGISQTRLCEIERGHRVPQPDPIARAQRIYLDAAEGDKEDVM